MSCSGEMGLRRVSVIALALVALGLAGCGGLGGGAPPPESTRHRIIYGPNAEPLSGGPLGSGKCAEALSAWFDRLDVGHTGAIGLPAFLADAQAQFARMDLNHDGFVTPDELSVYRRPFLVGREDDPPPPAQAVDSEPTGWGRRGQSPERPQPGGGGNLDRQYRSSSPPVDISADPVMSADTKLNFKVSTDDFLAQAKDVFRGLNAAHDGRLSRAEVMSWCTDTSVK